MTGRTINGVQLLSSQVNGFLISKKIIAMNLNGYLLVTIPSL